MGGWDVLSALHGTLYDVTVRGPFRIVTRMPPSRIAGARSAVMMLQQSIAARTAAQPQLLSLAGRLELATAQLQRSAAACGGSAVAMADGRTGAIQAVASGPDSDEEEPQAADALADGLDPHAGDSDDEEEEEDAYREAPGDSASEVSKDVEQEDSDLE